MAKSALPPLQPRADLRGPRARSQRLPVAGQWLFCGQLEGVTRTRAASLQAPRQALRKNSVQRAEQAVGLQSQCAVHLPQLSQPPASPGAGRSASAQRAHDLPAIRATTRDRLPRSLDPAVVSRDLHTPSANVQTHISSRSLSCPDRDESWGSAPCLEPPRTRGDSGTAKESSWQTPIGRAVSAHPKNPSSEVPRVRAAPATPLGTPCIALQQERALLHRADLLCSSKKASENSESFRAVEDCAVEGKFSEKGELVTDPADEEDAGHVPLFVAVPLTSEDVAIVKYPAVQVDPEKVPLVAGVATATVEAKIVKDLEQDMTGKVPPLMGVSVAVEETEPEKEPTFRSALADCAPTSAMKGCITESEVGGEPESEADGVSPCVRRASEAGALSPCVRRTSEADALSPCVRRVQEASVREDGEDDRILVTSAVGGVLTIARSRSLTLTPRRQAGFVVSAGSTSVKRHDLLGGSQGSLSSSSLSASGRRQSSSSSASTSLTPREGSVSSDSSSNMGRTSSRMDGSARYSQRAGSAKSGTPAERVTTGKLVLPLSKACAVAGSSCDADCPSNHMDPVSPLADSDAEEEGTCTLQNSRSHPCCEDVMDVMGDRLTEKLEAAQQAGDSGSPSDYEESFQSESSDEEALSTEGGNDDDVSDESSSCASED
eukprot:CAMPEP_0194537918 /NCGR_PEP_ID=MMETSP0253-20130528/77336_1 /TAXON_ID=2966 /ORGANISM="Noctiluca scintillans" /LENGTH=661 /DNA_ID=CAMNT_0039383979 /DNA_START=62 /DNA_END=2047 /DNA_ORIENTATION=-